MRGLFPDEYVRDLRLRRLRIDGRRFAREEFIERGPSLSEAERRVAAESLVTVLDPAYLERFQTFYAAVHEKVAGRTWIPSPELPEFHALRRLL